MRIKAHWIILNKKLLLNVFLVKKNAISLQNTYLVYFVFFFYKKYRTLFISFFKRKNRRVFVKQRKLYFFNIRAVKTSKKFLMKSFVSFKKKTMLFKRQNALKSAYYKKIYRQYKKKRFTFFKKKTKHKRFSRKFLDLKKKFFFTLRNNRKLIQTLFLKNFLRQKMLTKFFKKFKHKTLLNKTLVFEFSLFNILIQSSFNFLKTDMDFLINRGFVFLNGINCKNPFKMLKLSDTLQLAINSNFYLYNNFSKNWIRRVVYKIRCRMNYKSGKVYDMYKKRGKHTPNWVLKSLFYQNSIPKYLEVSQQILTSMIIKWPQTTSEFNFVFLKFISFQNLPLYNWKRCA